jgi:hypothetical protein
MLEGALVLTIVAALGLVALATTLLTPMLLAAIGVTTMLIGLVTGVPTGFWYHVVLYRVVSAKVPLPRRWWMSPAALHGHLSDVETRRVRRWYRIGGAGFVLCVAGGVVAIASLLAG